LILRQGWSSLQARSCSRARPSTERTHFRARMELSSCGLLI